MNLPSCTGAMNPSEAAWFLFLQPKYESQREAAMGYCTRAEFMEGCRNLGVNLGPLQVESLFSCYSTSARKGGHESEK